MSFGNALLNVLAIIAIVAVGGLLVYYLGGLLIKVIDHKKDEHHEIQETQSLIEDNLVKEQPQQNFIVEQEKQPEPSYEATISDEKFVLDDDENVKAVDYNKATDEKSSLNSGTVIPVETPAETPVETNLDKKPSDINDIFDEDKDFNFDDFDFDAFFEEQNNSEEKKNETTQKFDDSTYTDADLDNLFNEENLDDTDDKALASAPVTTSVIAEPLVATPIEVNNTATNLENTTNNYVSEHTNTTNTIETTKTVYVENHEVEDQLRAEIEELRNELAEQKKLYEALKTQSEQNQQKLQEEKSSLEILYQESEKREQETARIIQKQSEKSQTVLSIEEYQARLAILLERLKENEYELKQNRKEFLPLKRVRKTLDKDKAKLRRREALVAKQKVILYGVNNISDIDQEKAQKLAEDLELLEGLKVSVKHCEEVMEENKERYPILETANRILTTTNNDLKQDIHDCQVAILNLRKANGEDVDSIILEPLELEEVEKPAKRKRGRPRKSETQQKAVETQEINLPELRKSFGDDVTTIVHSAETEDDDISVDENTVIEKQTMVALANKEQQPTTVVVEDTEPQANTTTTTVSVKKEEFVKTQTTSNNQTTKTEHKFDFDADEPSYEDLFAIENEDLFEDDDDFFDKPNKK